MTPEIGGEVAPGFEPVRDAFAANLAAGLEVGAGVCVHVGGEKVVDVWGGAFERDGSGTYDGDTIQVVYSTTKGAPSVCVAMLVDRGVLDYDANVADYWPEFAAAGKADITVAQLMSHQAGLPVTDVVQPLEEILQWDPVVEALAAQAPMWEPGTAFGYHGITYGYLAGELVRRVTGLSFGQFFAADLAAPLGLDFWIGLPEAEEHRLTPMIPPPRPTPEEAAILAETMGPGTLGARAVMLNDAFLGAHGQMTWNTRAVHAAEVPAANGITNARSLSRMYAACIGEVDGVRLLSPEVVDRARTRLTFGLDRCLVTEMAFGLGFMAYGPLSLMGGPGSFGHAGAGGSLGFASPATGVAFGYAMNKMEASLVGDRRVEALTAAVQSCL
jgi:CubicO group peptidase (beta-lactamase class C family)